MNLELLIDFNFYKTCEEPEFIVTGLPRSMTSWASVFLSCNGVTCIHEPETIPGYVKPFGKVAYSSSGFPSLPHSIKRNTKIAIIDRDVNESFSSFKKLFNRNINEHKKMFYSLPYIINDLAEESNNVMRFSFEKLSKGILSEARNLFYFCHGTEYGFDEYRAMLLLGMNIQTRTTNILKHA